MTTRDLSAFSGVDLWIFDLDNTLYPRPEGLWQQVHERMQGFVSDLLGLDQAASEAIQRGYFREYGLTMRGLMIHHDIDPDVFNEHVHDVDLSEILPNRALGEAIAGLPGRKVIHTNSDQGHTARVLARLGIEDVFDAVYDIKATNYVPKPMHDPYEIVIAAEGGKPERAAMFEDSARNLAVPHEWGMRTVLVPTPCDVASDGADGAHVHFITDDLTGFVRAIDAGEAVA